jgi:L,D-peptidoglycan transpeptidase YkuD (ErfK/YbiS/YcfS/YnhG family)
MIIKLKNKETLEIDLFKFRCSVGNKGFTKKKTEGDKKTPRGIFSIGKLYYRKDRITKLETKLKTIQIKKKWVGVMM